MIVSRTPDGLSVLAEKTSSFPREFTRNGRNVRATLMAPHTGFGQVRWWEPDDPSEVSWWGASGRRVTTTHGLCVRPDGTTARVTASTHTADRGNPRETAREDVQADLHTVSHIPVCLLYTSDAADDVIDV